MSEQEGCCLPSSENFLDDPEALSSILGDRELAILHNLDRPEGEGPSTGEPSVSGIVRLEDSPDEVADCVTGFSSHDDFLPVYESVTIMDQSQDTHRVRYDTKVKMALLTLNVEFELEYRRTGQYKWIWSRKNGDIDSYRGRIELIQLDDGGTLLCMTSWIDFSGASWLLDMVLWAQPDLHVTLPATLNSVLLNGFHRELQDGPLDPSPDAEPGSPSPPAVRSLAGNTEDFETLVDGGLSLLFHPRQTISTSDGPRDILYTTGLTRIDESLNETRGLLSNFESYPEFVDQVDRVTNTESSDTWQSEWFFKLGLGLLSIPVSFTIDYQWSDENRLSFEMSEGKFDVIAGGLEWYELGSGKTLYGITSGSYIDENAPRLIRLANAVPYREIFMGVTLSTIMLQDSKAWVESQLP